MKREIGIGLALSMLILLGLIVASLPNDYGPKPQWDFIWGMGGTIWFLFTIVVLLVWVFYSAQIFLLGAEFTWLYAHNHGSRTNEAMPNAAA